MENGLGQRHFIARPHNLITLVAFADAFYLPIEVITTGAVVKFLNDDCIRTLFDDRKTERVRKAV